MSGEGGSKKPPADDDGWGAPEDLERAARAARDSDATGWSGPADPLADRASAAADEEAGEAAGVIESEPRHPAAAGEAEPPADDDAAAAGEPAQGVDAAAAGSDAAAAGEPAPVSEGDGGEGDGAESGGDADAEPPTDWGDEDGALPPPSPSLEEAVGLEEPPARPRRRLSRRQTLALVGGGLLVLAAGGIGVASWLNSQRYFLVCGSQSISAERGSAWPWGRNTLGGDRFRPIPIPASYECSERELDDREALEEAFLAALIQRSSELLTSGDPEAVAEAQAELEQALYLSRSPERRDTRAVVERLQGDVEYWQAAAEVQAAIDQLERAAQRFEAAAARRPRHNSDATAWAAHARGMGEEIRLGPPALRDEQPPPSPDGRPHFAGTGDDSPLGGAEAVAGAESATPAAAEPDEAVVPAANPAADAGTTPAAPAAAADGPAATPTPSQPDAGLPRGGVLL